MQNNDPQSLGEAPEQGQPDESSTTEVDSLQARLA